METVVVALLGPSLNEFEYVSNIAVPDIYSSFRNLKEARGYFMAGRWRSCGASDSGEFSMYTEYKVAWSRVQHCVVTS
ncbi:hypothetical protein Droror1_Dr00025282 [Drosera rotundifolia]